MISSYPNLSKRGCPLCRVAREAEQRFLRFFLFENYSSAPTLKHLEHACFCQRHAAQMAAGQNDHLSATFQFLAQVEQTRLGNVRQALTRESRGLFAWPQGHHLGHDVSAAVHAETCPACDVGANAVAVDILSLRAFLATDEGRDAYVAHDSGVCRSHLWLVLQDAVDEMDSWLMQETERRLQALLAEFDLYFHLLDYRFHDEPKGSEQTAWQRALRFFWSETDPLS